MKRGYIVRRMPVGLERREDGKMLEVFLDWLFGKMARRETLGNKLRRVIAADRR